MDDVFGRRSETGEVEEDITNWMNQGLTLAAGLVCGIMTSFLFRNLNYGRRGSSSFAVFDKFKDSKMVFVIRTDLAMSKGKVAAQCAHAAINCYRIASKRCPDQLKHWERFGQAKVTLKLNSEDELLELEEKAAALGLVTSIVKDAGRTQIDPGTKTVLGIGPGSVELIDKVTGQLKLY